jgi:hypothetical protein
MLDSNPMSLLMNNLNHPNQTPSHEKEPMNNIDSESRDFVTVGSNEEIFIPALNNTKQPPSPKQQQKQPIFQVVSEEDVKNIMH